MKKKTLNLMLLIFVLVLLLGFILLLIYNHDRELVFYGTVSSSNKNSSNIVINSDDELSKTYKEIVVDTGSLNVGDIVKFVCKGSIMETYPPKASVRDYEILVHNTTSTEITTTEVITETTVTTNTIINKDEVVLNDINVKSSNVDDPSIKDYFVKVVDFIFYDKDINGVYFKDLSNEAKLKVTSLALKLDNAIESKYPNYKDSFSDSYKNAKSSLINLYLDNTSTYCKNHDKVCDQAKEDFNSLKTSLNITWDFIKSASNAGLSKLKEWYQIYSGK